MIAPIWTCEWRKLYFHSDVRPHCSWSLPSSIPSSPCERLILWGHIVHLDGCYCFPWLRAPLGANELLSGYGNYEHHLGGAYYRKLHCRMSVRWVRGRNIYSCTILRSSLPAAICDCWSGCVAYSFAA